MVDFEQVKFEIGQIQVIFGQKISNWGVIRPQFGTFKLKLGIFRPDNS